jgi:nucleotide-binding universal stress UspA family protein
MINKILAATDGSDHARKAVELAAEIATKFDASLLLIHIFLRGPLPAELRHLAEVEHLIKRSNQKSSTNLGFRDALVILQNDPDDAVEARNAVEAIGRQIVEGAARLAREKGVQEVRTITDYGSAADCISDIAKREGVDLIVMGSRGLGEVKGLLVGSTSHKVAQLAACACLTVK